MNSPAKFLFDTDFGTTDRNKAAMVPLADHTAGVAEADALGFRRGHAAAKAEAEQRTAMALERIAVALAELNRGLAAVETRLETEAVEVAVAVARKLAPELVAREPFAELAALAAQCFAHLVGVPHVVVRVNDTLYPAVRDPLDAAARARGFDGRLIVLAEPDIAPGDCRIEWADGGVMRDRVATEAAIDDAVARYLGRAPAGRPRGSLAP